MNKIIEAALFAAAAHHGQKRKYNGLPYIHHPLRVMGRTMLLPYATEDLICAAVNHDVVEDCNVGVQEIIDRFGTVVGTYVAELTNPSKGWKLPRAECKQMDRDHIAKISDEAKAIKMLDRIDNLREMEGSDPSFHKKYLDESLLLWEVVKDADQELGNELFDLIESQKHVLSIDALIADELLKH